MEEDLRDPVVLIQLGCAVEPGQVLRNCRNAHGMTLRDLAAATRSIAVDLDNEEFAISAARLCQIEKSGVVPNIYRLYSLSAVLGIELRELLFVFGIPRE